MMKMFFYSMYEEHRSLTKLDILKVHAILPIQDCLTDLMKYYKEAPGFLGGSDKKAEEISIRLKILKEKNTISFNYHHVTGNEQYI